MKFSFRARLWRYATNMQVHPITPKPKPKPSITPKPSANPSANPSPLALRTDGSASRLAQERQPRHPEKKRCVLPGAAPPSPLQPPPRAPHAARACACECSACRRRDGCGSSPLPSSLPPRRPASKPQVCGPPGCMYRALLRARPEADLMRIYTCSVLAHFRLLSTLEC